MKITRYLLPTLAIAALSLAGCSSTDNTPSNSAGAASEPGSSVAGGTGVAPAANVSLEDAVATAQAAVTGDLVEVEFDDAGSVLTYTVSVVTQADDVDVIVDATTGDIIRQDAEPLDPDDAIDVANERFTLDGVVSPDDAIAAAIAQVSGTPSGWSLDRDERGLTYSVEMQSSTGDVDVVVDATTGAVVATDD